MSVNRMVTTAAFVTGVTADTRLSTGTRLRYPRPGYEAGQLVSELGIGQAATGGPTKPANGRFSKARQAATGRAATVGDHAECGQKQPFAGCAGRSVRTVRQRVIASDWSRGNSNLELTA